MDDLSIHKFFLIQDPKVNTDKVLCLAVMCIWSWSLMQFTIIVPASKVRSDQLESSISLDFRAKQLTLMLLAVIKPRKFVAIWMFGEFWSM